MCIRDSSDNDGVFPTESLSRVNADLNAGTELNKWVSMDGKISLSRTKADNRPLYGDYGAISQLMRIPNNVRLDDLKQYSDETHAHVNWTCLLYTSVPRSIPVLPITVMMIIVKELHGSGLGLFRMIFRDW